MINHLPGDEVPASELAREVADGGRLACSFAPGVSREDEVEAHFQDMALAQWRKVMAVNLDGQFLCARTAVREFLRRGPQPEVSSATGKIICMSSVHQVIPWAFEANYAASKGRVMLLMQSLAQELVAERIQVTAVAPGARSGYRSIALPGTGPRPWPTS